MPGRSPDTPDDLGRAAAHLKWYPDGTNRMTWAEVSKELRLPRSRVRTAARRYMVKQEGRTYGTCKGGRERTVSGRW
jgi:hypothetical protein